MSSKVLVLFLFIFFQLYLESDSHNPAGPLITHIEPRENLDLACSGAAFNSKTQSSEHNVHLDNPNQQNFLRIPSLTKAPPDLDSLEADLNWEMTTTRL